MTPIPALIAQTLAAMHPIRELPEVTPAPITAVREIRQALTIDNDHVAFRMDGAAHNTKEG